FRVYAQIAENATMEQVSEAIKDVKADNIEPDYAQRNQPELFLHPMKKWYLYGQFENGKNVGGRITYVRVFGIIGLFVLVLACINFMNLSTARSEKRAKEVGIRKTLGSVRSQIVGQFYSESILVALFAFALALLLTQLFLPTFNEISGKEIALLWSSPWFWASSIGFMLFTGLLAGSYPSFYLSSFQPIKVLKGTFRAGKWASVPRKVLVVLQFTVSISLIIGTVFVFKQIQHAKNRPTNYNRDNIVRIPIKNKDAIIPHLRTLETDLLNSGGLTSVAITDSRITSMGTTNGGFTWEGKDPNASNDFTTLRVTYDFGKMVDWQIVEGRDFSKDFATDSTAFVINEAAVEYMGLENPVGTIMRRGDYEHRIVGVVKNMITQSPYEPVRQMLFMLHEGRFHNFINVKLHPESDVRETLAKVETIIKKYDPINDFEYEFADDTFARKFGDEERIGKLAAFFAGLAIIISCLGLFGLATYMAEQRTKEIGIRKVLGASVTNLWQLLSKEFILLVVIASILAIPFAYYFTNNWLANYTYRTEVSWWVFVVVSLLALVITLVTVSVQAVRAALVNPVKAIQQE
ncbi:MAG: FtsX-like permease family protein, partial [Bacteroidota bacterium]